MGLADDVGKTQFFQIHGGQHGIGQAVANGNHGAVKIPYSQGAQYVLVPCVTHHGVGHFAADLLDQLIMNIHSQDLTAQGAQPPGHFAAEPAQAHNNITFHKCLLFLSDEKICLGILIALLGLVPHQEAQAQGQHPHSAEVHIENN